ncbi:hypothetical protein CcaverHIS002_0302820 [Cutaneotrichosporon cavernicola]|nr:hypothetical protein CcaverHIS002_0302820 [Cutaneotrichosporon cavernicola]
MPYISTEALVGAALVVVLAFGYQHMTSTGSNGNNNDSSTAAKKKNKKNKNKKKAGTDTPIGTPVAVSEAEEPKSEPKKGKKGKHSTTLEHKVKPAPVPVLAAVAVPATSEESEEFEPPSFAAAAKASAPTKPKTLAEKLVPKVPKTKVDDMLAPEDRPPQLARVMRVVQPEKVDKFADDYASSEWSDEPRQDDGWNVVAAKKKPMSVSIAGGGDTNSSPARSRAIANEPLTKLQRKNQKKTEAKRVAKEAEEADRLRRLALHKKDLEREKINAIYNKQQKKVVRERGRVVDGGSGGQGATLNQKGQLVWD